MLLSRKDVVAEGRLAGLPGACAELDRVGRVEEEGTGTLKPGLVVLRLHSPEGIGRAAGKRMKCCCWKASVAAMWVLLACLGWRKLV